MGKCGKYVKIWLIFKHIITGDCPDRESNTTVDKFEINILEI